MFDIKEHMRESLVSRTHFDTPNLTLATASFGLSMRSSLMFGGHWQPNKSCLRLRTQQWT